ncbi:MAG: DNA gyrase subunit A [Chloroflexi bacterium]|nr:DNA gyrase subunit A [Chloroflexota bacterium]
MAEDRSHDSEFDETNGSEDWDSLNPGRVQPINLEREMRVSYLDYAMSVIVSRALPDARDGLKPVHRRILYVMYDMGLHYNRSHRKSARIVGEVLGKYHPHGDTAVYDAMARMAQDFSLRYPLVDGQGNFGSVDGDRPAAMRYTEARLERIAGELLEDIDKDTVDWSANFDDSLQEPNVLPARLPNLLLNGASGIAVGMATNVPPHNLSEIADAIAYTIDHWEDPSEVTIEALMQFVQGPDFPTGGIIMGMDGIKQAYGTGRGRLIVRAKTEIQEMRGDRFRIIVTEIPYQLNKTTLIERIADLARSDRMTSISDLRDESDRKGMRIVIELKRGAAPKKELNKLFKYTPLQTTFGVINLALVENQPRLLTLKRSLQVYVEHRVEVITRRTQWELAQAEHRAHILEGLRIALEFLDEVIATIRQSDTVDDARTALIERFALSEIQAQAILDMQLRRLAALERQKIEDEYDGLMVRINYLRDLLEHPAKILALVREDILEVKEKYADERRTEINPFGGGDFREEDLVTQRGVIVTLTESNYIKHTDVKVFRAQGRGGVGVRGIQTKSEDAVVKAVFARTLDHVLFFTNSGRVYSERAYNLPEGSRTAKGANINNVLNLQPREVVTALIPVEDFGDSEYIVLCSKRGKVKRMPLSEFERVRPSGIIAVNLAPDDELVRVKLTTGTQDIIIVTARGKALRFHEDALRPMGRTAAGVMGIRLLDDDTVAGMAAVSGDEELLIVTEKGWGKRVEVSDLPVKGRYTQGVWITDNSRLEETGPIVVARSVLSSDDVTFMTLNGVAMRTRVDDINLLGRSTRGVRCVRLQPGDALVSAARVVDIKTEEEEEQVDTQNGDLDDIEAPLESVADVVEPPAEATL